MSFLALNISRNRKLLALPAAHATREGPQEGLLHIRLSNPSPMGPQTPQTSAEEGCYSKDHSFAAQVANPTHVSFLKIYIFY